MANPRAQCPSPREQQRQTVVACRTALWRIFASPAPQAGGRRAVQFQSDTDTEVIVHLVGRYISRGLSLEVAVRGGAEADRGRPCHRRPDQLEPDKLVTARLGNAGGVTIGMGEGEMFVASDMPAILEHTQADDLPGEQARWPS